MNEDTKHLLKECDAGTKMAVENINQLLPSIHNPDFRDGLEKYRNAHVSFGDQMHNLLSKSGEDSGDLSPMAKASARIMTSMKLVLDDSDKKIASMLTDGCNMGMKTIAKYLNQYANADITAKKIADNIIRLEESMMEDLREYL